MNIIDYISRNTFLESIFPNGLTDVVLLGQIKFDIAGKIFINIHTQQKPAAEIIKWGIWGEDYNVIVIELSGGGGEDIQIENWMNCDFAPLSVIGQEGRIYIIQSGASWRIKIDFDDLIFQKCHTYTI